MFFARNTNYNIDEGKAWCVCKFSKTPAMSCVILSNSFFFTKFRALKIVKNVELLRVRMAVDEAAKVVESLENVQLLVIRIH